MAAYVCVRERERERPTAIPDITLEQTYSEPYFLDIAFSQPGTDLHPRPAIIDSLAASLRIFDWISVWPHDTLVIIYS